MHDGMRQLVGVLYGIHFPVCRVDKGQQRILISQLGWTNHSYIFPGLFFPGMQGTHLSIVSWNVCIMLLFTLYRCGGVFNVTSSQGVLKGYALNAICTSLSKVG